MVFIHILSDTHGRSGATFYILIVSNESCRTLYDGDFVTYLPEELTAIYQLSPDFIMKLHRIKKLCDGDILTKGMV